jgi:hypothetical protein
VTVDFREFPHSAGMNAGGKRNWAAEGSKKPVFTGKQQPDAAEQQPVTGEGGGKTRQCAAPPVRPALKVAPRGAGRDMKEPDVVKTREATWGPQISSVSSVGHQAASTVDFEECYMKMQHDYKEKLEKKVCSVVTRNPGCPLRCGCDVCGHCRRISVTGPISFYCSESCSYCQGIDRDAKAQLDGHLQFVNEQFAHCVLIDGADESGSEAGGWMIEELDIDSEEKKLRKSQKKPARQKACKSRQEVGDDLHMGR